MVDEHADLGKADIKHEGAVILINEGMKIPLQIVQFGVFPLLGYGGNRNAHSGRVQIGLLRL